MPRGNTGAAPRKRVTASEAIAALKSMHLAGTDKHPPESWRAMRQHLLDAMPTARCNETREALANYAADCDRFAERAELAAKPPVGFYTARPLRGASTFAPVTDNAGWLRADAEIDADDNTDTTGDEGRWGFEW